MSFTRILDYREASKFTLDSGLAIDSTTGLSLELTTYENEIYYNPFVFDGEATALRGEGSLIGTLAGAATVSSDTLDLTGSNAYLEHTQLILTDMTQSGTIQMMYTPNYSGFPPATESLFTLYSTSGASTIRVTIGTSSMAITVKHSGNGNVINNALTSPTFTSGTPILFELSYDFINGTTNLYADGISIFDSSVTSITTPVGPFNIFRVGATETAIEQSYATFDYVRMWSDVQHTANYPGDLPLDTPYSYPFGEYTALWDGFEQTSEILSYVEDATTPSGTEIGYVFKDTLTEIRYYFIGDVFTVSDGTLAQSNTAAEIDALGPTAFEDGFTGTMLTILEGDGWNTPTIVTGTYVYEFFSVPVVPSKCLVYGYVLDVSGEPIEGATIEASHGGFFDHTNRIVRSVSTTADAIGEFQMLLAESATSSTVVRFTITYTENGEQVTNVVHGIIPDEPVAPLSSFAG